MNNKISSAIDQLLTKGKLVQAGLWQGDKSFQDYKMKVLRNRRLTLDIPQTKDFLASESQPDVEWAEEHFHERIGGIPTNPGVSYKRWPYANFKNGDPYMEGKIFSHTYQERFWPKTANSCVPTSNWGVRYELGDLDDVIKQLKDNPLTRQAYLPIFFPEDTGAKDNIRVPCTLGYYFWIEDNYLHCNYIIRSCDAYRHFRNDIYLTGRLMQHISKKLEVMTGTLDIFIFNFHVFQNDEYMLNKKEQKLQKEYGE